RKSFEINCPFRGRGPNTDFFRSLFRACARASLLTSDSRLYRITAWQASKTPHAAGIRDSPRRQEWETRSIQRARIRVPKAPLLLWPRPLAAPIHRERFRLYPPVPCPLQTAVSPAPQSGGRTPILRAQSNWVSHCEAGWSKKRPESPPAAPEWRR